jgi:hypothetical protein
LCSCKQEDWGGAVNNDGGVVVFAVPVFFGNLHSSVGGAISLINGRAIEFLESAEFDKNSVGSI